MDATATKMPMTRLSNILIRLDIVLQRYYAEYNLMQLALSLTLSLSLPSDIDTESQTQQRDLWTLWMRACEQYRQIDTDTIGSEIV